MSLTKKKRETIKHYILEQIDLHCNDVVNKTVEVFGITSTSVYRYMKEMVENGIIHKIVPMNSNEQVKNMIAHVCNTV